MSLLLRPSARLCLARAAVAPPYFFAAASTAPRPAPWPEAYNAKCFVVCVRRALSLKKNVTIYRRRYVPVSLPRFQEYDSKLDRYAKVTVLQANTPQLCDACVS